MFYSNGLPYRVCRCFLFFYVMLGGLGFQEIIIIALIVLLLFGGKKIPELMKGLGKGVKSFKDGVNGVDDKNEVTDNKKDNSSESKVDNNNEQK